MIYNYVSYILNVCGPERFAGDISSEKTVDVSRRAKESREEVSSVRKRAIWILSWLLAAALLQTGCEPGRQTEKPAESEAAMRISIESDTQSIVFQLNDSSAAKSLYDQLPLTATVENFGGNEKIFYPPEPLEVSGTPMAEGPAGTLAYYEPWGDVAIFYGTCGRAAGLYALGEAISGAEQIEALAGEIRIEKVENAPLEETTQQSAAPVPTGREPADGTEQEENAEMKINVQAGGRTFTATLEKNAAAEAFAELMKNAPLVLSLSDYAGFEKVGALGTSLPAEDRQITAQAGDIVLYNGIQIVLFYGANSWSYTKLGRIDDLSGWEEALGGGDITVSFSIE